MKVISNGIEREADVFKHFKIGLDEYVLYKNVNGISIAVINGNDLVAPAPEKLEGLMKVLGSLIGPSPNESILMARDCVLLSEVMEASFNEVSYQNVNITEEQLRPPVPTLNVPIANQVPNASVPSMPSAASQEKPKADNKMKIYGIIIVILVIVFVIVMFGDKIFKKGGGTPVATPEPVVTPAPVPTNNSVTTVSEFNLNDSEQSFIITNNPIAVKASNKKIYVNNLEIATYADSVKVYATDRYLLIANVGQYETFVKAVNETGGLMEITGIQSSESEVIGNIRVENGFLMATVSNQLDPSIASKNVEFVYENNQIVVREV